MSVHLQAPTYENVKSLPERSDFLLPFQPRCIPTPGSPYKTPAWKPGILPSCLCPSRPSSNPTILPPLIRDQALAQRQLDRAAESLVSFTLNFAVHALLAVVRIGSSKEIDASKALVDFYLIPADATVAPLSLRHRRYWSLTNSATVGALSSTLYPP